MGIINCPECNVRERGRRERERGGGKEGGREGGLKLHK